MSLIVLIACCRASFALKTVVFCRNDRQNSDGAFGDVSELVCSEVFRINCFLLVLSFAKPFALSSFSFIR